MLRVQIVDTPFRSETGGIHGFQSLNPSVNRTAVISYRFFFIRLRTSIFQTTTWLTQYFSYSQFRISNVSRLEPRESSCGFRPRLARTGEPSAPTGRLEPLARLGR